ncbi:hypothetical protein QR90_08490 [Deinococcus radiopugnans]|uniref:Membrane dipeptidase n=1 Tax=Deinococcus radiopugnans TaxID=57497 RepID=A0A0A7KG55_9DEIO|nr:membrane dipeptidase [Deinococcus radiopugnans]AIZ45131.1 hypothetical protein QR90_08490 [Deinococcus radiopugnans]
MTAAARPNRGFHDTLERRTHLYVDACIQAWPDADYADAHRHGATAYGVTAFMPHVPFEQAVEDLMFWHLVARQHPHLSVAFSAQDIRNAHARGDAVFVLSSQDGDFVGQKLHRIETLYRLGLRVTLLAYNRTNTLSGGVFEAEDTGLTRLGVRVVQECNRVGMVLDGSHMARRATLEMIETSADPAVFTHANPRHLCQHPRNITDEQILACTARGGVIGLVNWGPLVQKDGQLTRPTLDDFIDHLDYVCDLTGSARHVGIGSDMSLGTYPPHDHDPWGDGDYPNPMGRYNLIPDMPTAPTSPLRFADGFDSFAQVPQLTGRLAERGYSDEDIGAFLGGNFLRVFEQVWKPVEGGGT